MVKTYLTVYVTGPKLFDLTDGEDCMQAQTDSMELPFPIFLGEDRIKVTHYGVSISYISSSKSS